MEQLLLFDFEKEALARARAEAMSRLPLYTPLYYKWYDTVGRTYINDQDFNSHSFFFKSTI